MPRADEVAPGNPATWVVSGGIGASVLRPDGPPKARGDYRFASDLTAPGMLWGRVLRSPHAAARIIGIDLSGATRLPGVHAILTARDVPGRRQFGLEVADQPVFAEEVVRYHGEAVAAVVADSPEVARRACAAITVEYEAQSPLLDLEAAMSAPPVHPDGNVLVHQRIRFGDPAGGVDDANAIVVEGVYETAMQDQTPLGPEACLATPTDDGVALYVATQWLHSDRAQIAASLGLPEERVHLRLAGVGGAFGAREDVSVQIHACLLARAVGRPVKMVFSREEAFLGHVHRHPARLWYRHRASRDGELLSVEARVMLDGGAYASSSHAVLSNAVTFAAGPYHVRAASVDGYAVRTNRPPCGAMRGFGAVQVCFGYEAQMDRLAKALGLDPIAFRLRNALRSGDRLITGQIVRGTAPVREVIEATIAHPLPPPLGPHPLAADLPGGTGRTTRPGDVRRGVGFALGFKNIAYSAGFDDDATASVRLGLDEDGEPVATVHCAAAEVGQGFVTLAGQIVRTELGVRLIAVLPADTEIGSAGSTSASRQSWMSGGAIQAACAGVRAALCERLAPGGGLPPADLVVTDGEVRSAALGVRRPLADLIGETPIEWTEVYRHRPTQPLDADGQGDAHVALAFVAHRAVVDVDTELGLVRVVQVATGQDVGRVLNPLQATGQLEGGIVQGVGLAVMEEFKIDDAGRVRTPGFADYVIPTAMDVPDVAITFVEQPEPGAPYGAKGIGELPTVSSTAAVVAAIRDATGRALHRAPVTPDDLVLAGRSARAGQD